MIDESILLVDDREPEVGEVFDVRIEHLVMRPPVPCGMNIDTILGKLKLYRTTRQHEGPADVCRRPGLPAPYWELGDGRHRLFPAVIGGRAVLRCRREK